MTVPASSDITVYQGDTFEYFFRIKDTATGVYFDLTGWTIRAQIRATAAAVNPLATFTVTLSNQATIRGGCLLSLTPVQTAALSKTGGVWDVEFTEPDGTVTTYIAGKVEVIEEVTR